MCSNVVFLGCLLHCELLRSNRLATTRTASLQALLCNVLGQLILLLHSMVCFLLDTFRQHFSKTADFDIFDVIPYWYCHESIYFKLMGAPTELKLTKELCEILHTIRFWNFHALPVLHAVNVNEKTRHQYC